ncbi:MAG: family 20 glycosylhydrolase, partial [Methanococcaceae archaeon]
MKYRFLLSTLLAIFCSSIHAQNNSLPIIPLPQIVTFTSGNFALPKKPVIILSGTNTQANRFAAEVINQTLKSFYNTGAVIKEGAPEKGAIVLFQYSQPQTGETDLPAGFLTEGYKMLSTKDGIIIKSLSQNGILYGSMSLVQLLEKAVNKSLPAFEITDWPDMKIRGISDDISRGQVSTLENFKKIIRSLARYKMNVYMPYLEDMIKFDAYPSIGENRGALTKNEVRELVSYAGMYGIDVVPAFQTLGHYENILSKPEFLKYAEFPGAASLNISYDSTYIFLNKMLKEIFDLFPSKYFNMGADETYDVGLGKSKALVANSSMPNALLNHYKKVYDIIKNSGRKVLMYGDIILSHPEILDSLPKDIILVDWHYRADTEYPSTKIFSRAGHDYYVSPSVWNFQTTFPTQVNAI